MLVVKIFMSCGKPVVYEMEVEDGKDDVLIKHTRCRNRKEANELKTQILLTLKIKKIGVPAFSPFATQEMKCRKLYVHGFTTLEISRILGCRYQQVANALEELF